MLLLIVFWGAVALILYTYLGFIALLATRAVLFPKPVQRQPITPSISLIIVAYNEADVITEKLHNASAADYPAEKLEIIVASDGSADKTVALARAFESEQVKVFDLPRQGKNRTLNQAVGYATGEILVMTDADSMLDKQALRKLAEPFADADVGAVGGNYFYATDVAEGKGERTYWGLDRTLKLLQSRGGSMTSATGQLYAIRRELFRPVPNGVTDDFYTSTQALAAHQRLIFAPEAKVYGPVAGSVRSEYRRKVRVMTRGLNSVWQMRELLNPFQYGFYAIQLLTHKVLRRLLSVPLLMIFIASWLLWETSWFYQLAALSKTAFYGLGIAGYVLRQKPIGKQKIFSIPLYFQMVYLASLVAVWNVLSGKQFNVWRAERADAANIYQSEV